MFGTQDTSVDAENTDIQWPLVSPTPLRRVCFDLDGVLAEDTWPNPAMGKYIRAGLEGVMHYFALGFEIIVYSSRPESQRKLITDWFIQNGLDEYI